MKRSRNSAGLRTKLDRSARSLLGVLGLFAVIAAAQPEPHKSALVLSWYSKDHYWNTAFQRGFQSYLRTDSSETIEYYPEYLETNRFPGERQLAIMHAFLREKYRDQTIDVLVANSDTGLDFFLKYRRDLFPSSPIVFVATRNPLTEQHANGPGVTGIINLNPYNETIDLALRLHPGTEQIFVVSGTLERDKRYEINAREVLSQHQSSTPVTYLTDLSPDELTATMKILPKRSIVLYVWQQARDESGKVIESEDILSSLARSASAPVYALSSFLIRWDSPSAGFPPDDGVVGGYTSPADVVGAAAAEIVLRIAHGERADDIPVKNAPTVPMFDWRELKRWGISADALPPGSIVRFKELTLWDQYKWRIIGVIALLTVQAVLIGGLLIQRSRRSRAEEARRLSEANLQRLTGRLISAQEEERRHIARELHDDLNQQVAALAIGLGKLERQLPGPDGPVHSQITKLEDKTTGLSEWIRRLSHQLHSTTLEHVGLEEALKASCSEFQDQQGISVTFNIRGEIPALPANVALCLYRVTQESLRNIAKHSGSQDAELTLIANNESIELRIADHGIGFDSRRTLHEEGLGLVSIQERVRLVGGRLEVDSQPRHGTELKVHVPIRATNE